MSRASTAERDLLGLLGVGRVGHPEDRAARDDDRLLGVAGVVRVPAGPDLSSYKPSMRSRPSPNAHPAVAHSAAEHEIGCVRAPSRNEEERRVG